jgi:Pectate lyase superfamily protein
MHTFSGRMPVAAVAAALIGLAGSFSGALAHSKLPPLFHDSEEPIVFPDDAGVINVTQPPYNAKGDGVADDTDAIQMALDDHPSGNRIIYLPNGTYLVSHQIEFGISRRRHPDRKIDGRDPAHQRLTILQGESRDHTIIKLKDHCEDFQSVGIEEWGKDIGRPKARGVVWTGETVAQHFRNALRNLTIDTGKANAGAAGVQFNASNQGCMHAVKIVSGDGQGAIGLDIGYTGDSGPAVVRHVEIIGFDYGIWAANLNSFTLWDVALKGQSKSGIRSPYEVLTLHRIRSENRVPALWIGNRWSSHVTLIDAELTAGSPDQPAILIDGKPNEKHFFGRNIEVSGYGLTVKSTVDERLSARGDLDEYSYGPVTKAFPDCVGKTLRLPIKEAPEISWGDIKKDWANVLTFGAKGDGKTDDTEAVQKAIDGGAKVVYFPAGKIYRCKDLILRGNVQRFVACEAYINAERLDVRDGTAPAVVVERFMPPWDHGRMDIHQQSLRPLIVRDINGSVYQESMGPVFLDDVCGGLYMNHPGASAWCRYFNYEVSPGLGVVNNGGNLWIMGGKIEHPNPQVELLNGSRTEIFGAMWYAGFEEVVTQPGMRIADSAASIICHRQHSFGAGRWKNWIQVERHGERFLWTDWNVDFLSTATLADLPAAGGSGGPEGQ